MHLFLKSSHKFKGLFAVKSRLFLVLTLLLFMATLFFRKESMASMPLVTQALPYPFIATAYRSLGQEQITFNPDFSSMDKQEAFALREMFILVDRATYLGVQMLWWFESDGKQGRSQKTYDLQMDKLLERFEKLNLKDDLESVKNLILLGLKTERDELLNKASFSFENKRATSDYFLGQAYEILFQYYAFENAQNRKAFNCHLSALAAVGIRSRTLPSES